MAIPVITPLPDYPGTPPNRTQPPSEFNENMADAFAYLAAAPDAFNTWTGQLTDIAEYIDNAAAGYIADAVDEVVAAAGFASAAAASSSTAGISAAQAVSAKDLALGAANFKGSWLALTGALNVPASVYHNGLTWILLSNLVDVTASEPNAGSVWAVASGDSFRRYVDAIFSRALLDLNFAGNSYKVYEQYGLEPKQLTSALQTLRASSAVYNSPFGLLTAGVDTPTIEYSENTGEALGLNSRPASTNLLLHSQYTAASADLPPTGWASGGSTDTGVTTTASSPRMVGATRLTATGSSQREVISQVVTLGAATTYTFSCYFAQGTSATDNVLRVISADAATGTLALAGSAVTEAGVYSITFTTVAGGSYTAYVGLGCSGNATGTVIHETPQLGVGDFYTGYIPTTTAQVARAATQPRRDLANNFNLAAGVFYVEFIAQSSGNLERLIAIGDTNTTQECSINYTSTGSGNKIIATIRAGGSNVNLTPPFSFTAGQVCKAALRYVRTAAGTYDWTVCVNGSLSTSTNTSALPTGYDKLAVGCRRYNSATLQPYTPIRRAAYLGGTFTNADLQAITA